MERSFKKLPTRHTVTQDIIDQFTQMIKDGALKVGDKLPPERVLSEQFGVGRSTLREALKSMASMGLIQSRQGEGTFIADIDFDSIKTPLQWSIFLNPSPINELVDLRMLLELAMVKSACENRSEKDLVLLDQSIVLMKAESENAGNYDLMFHMTIGKASGNQLMHNLLDLIRLSLEEWFEKVLIDEQNLSNTIFEHEEILQAIREKDSKKAAKYMREHLERGTKRLMEIVSKTHQI